MLRYGLYTRKSHDDKKLTEKSTGEQVSECRALAEREGLSIAWECEESKSAKTPGQRQHYNELIRQIEKGRLEGILCWHVNRLVRNMEEGGKLVQLLIDGKIREIRTPHSIYRSGENILSVVIEAASATQHSIDLVHTVKRSSKGNFLAGGWNHKAPPGYRNVRDQLNTKRGQVELDADRWPLIRKVWECVLAGDHNVSTVTKNLESWGYRVRPSLNLPSRPLSYAAVLSLLRNPFYVGFVKENGELVRGRHKPMVSISEFNRIQSFLDRRSFTAKRVHHHSYSGLMRCGYCGQYVTAETKRLKNGSWEVYHCSDTYNKCTQKGLSAARVDDELARCLESLEIDPRLLEIGMEAILSGVEEQTHSLEARRQEQRKTVASVQERLARLTDMWLSGMLTDKERFKSLEQGLLSEMKNLQLEVDDEKSGIQLIAQNVSVASTMISNARSRLATVPPGIKRVIAEAVGTYTFYGREKRIQLDLHPVLREVVSFLGSNLTPLEPAKKGSRKQNEAVPKEQLRAGGGRSAGIEVPESLFRALAEHELTLPPCFALEAAAGDGLKDAA